jgi:hypothetical protein
MNVRRGHRSGPREMDCQQVSLDIVSENSTIDWAFESSTRKNVPRVSLLSDWFYRNGRRINIAAKDIWQG